MSEALEVVSGESAENLNKLREQLEESDAASVAKSSEGSVSTIEQVLVERSLPMKEIGHLIGMQIAALMTTRDDLMAIACELRDALVNRKLNAKTFFEDVGAVTGFLRACTAKEMGDKYPKKGKNPTLYTRVDNTCRAIARNFAYITNMPKPETAWDDPIGQAMAWFKGKVKAGESKDKIEAYINRLMECFEDQWPTLNKVEQAAQAKHDLEEAEAKAKAAKAAYDKATQEAEAAKKLLNS